MIGGLIMNIQLGEKSIDSSKIISFALKRLDSFDIRAISRTYFYGKSKNPGIVTIKSICDGLEISLYDFFNDDLFKTNILDD